jgi:RNA 2',3'-cyclic 3'-phosphodiesterase
LEALYVRCFVGFFLPKEAVEVALERQSRLSHAKFTWKMVEPQNLHINLSFLGEIGESEVGNVSSGLEEICRNHKPFSVTVGNIELIPSEKRPRVVALHAIEGSGELKSLTNDVKGNIGGDSKPPHITLGRVRNVIDSDSMVGRVGRLNLEASTSPKCSFEVLSIGLIKSELGRDGPTYTTLRSYPFGKKCS